MHYRSSVDVTDAASRTKIDQVQPKTLSKQCLKTHYFKPAVLH